MSDGKPIQLAYARPMPRDPNRISPFALIVTLLLTLATTCVTFVTVMYLLAWPPRTATLCGIWGRALALLATLWSLGRSRGMLLSNLVLFFVSVAGVITGAWMS